MSSREEKLSSIQASALSIFAEQGIDGVGMREIASRAGMAPANIYNYYPSKSRLVQAIFTDGYRLYSARIKEAMQIEGDFRLRMGSAVRAICILHDEDPQRFRFLIIQQHNHLNMIPREADLNPVELVCRTVAEAVATGDIPPADPDLLGLSIIGIVIQAATGLLYGRIKGTLTDRSNEIVELCERISL